jgi:hypothetical protein
MKDIAKYASDRLKEPSTWRGIILILAAVGVKLSPELADAIIASGISLAGVIAILTRG